MNLPASRLAGLLIAGAAALRGADAGGALRAMARDARRHRSPNAGWPEAAMAGALGLKLAGPRVYDGALVPDAHMGDGRAEATADDIARALWPSTAPPAGSRAASCSGSSPSAWPWPAEAARPPAPTSGGPSV